MKKKWEELGISNDFLFGKVMRDPEVCRELLETILNVSIERIEYPEEQKVLDLDRDARSVRLDVYVADGQGTVYDLEMQATDTKELPKRSRYYTGMIDLGLLEKGESYKKLKPSFVIFICTFDTFGRGRHRYTFENRCREEPDLKLEDGTCKVFLNAKGIQDDVSGDLKAFLDYVAGRKTENEFVEKLDAAVQKVKENQEWRREYMTLLMRDQENIEKGIEQGIKQGIKQGIDQGREEKGREMILEMLRNHIPIETIAKIAGMDIARIQEMKESL